MKLILISQLINWFRLLDCFRLWSINLDSFLITHHLLHIILYGIYGYLM